MSKLTSSAVPRVPFDSLTLRAVVSQLRSRLIGGQVQDIRQPSPSEVRLGIRSQGRNDILVLSCDARFARVHLTKTRQPNAPVPPSFCMAMRKHCEGAIVRDVRQRGFDRVLELEIGARGGESDTATVTVVAELMGKHSNLILVSGSGIVLEAAKRISQKVSRFREVLPGLPYQAPPGQEGRIDPLDQSAAEILRSAISSAPLNRAEDRAAWLVERVEGMSPFLARDIALRLYTEHEEHSGRLVEIWTEIFGLAAQDAYRPVAILSGDRTVAAYPFPVAQLSPEVQRHVTDLNATLDVAYSDAVARERDSAALNEFRGQIERDRKRIARQKELAERTLLEVDRAEQYKQAGELILANLWRIEPGAATITVQDYFDPALAERTLTLDPKLSPGENSDALFRRYRKVRDGQATAIARSNEAAGLLAELNAARARLAEWEERGEAESSDLQSLRDELRAHGLLQQRGGDAEEEGASGPDLQGHKIRRFSTPEGYEIYIGETATANDYLTTRLAAPNDLWLHVRASTSAHVIIRSRGRPDEVPRSVLEYAALLCARHSSQKHSGLVPVDYTLKKHVRKPRGAAPGSADYHHETTLHITP